MRMAEELAQAVDLRPPAGRERDHHRRPDPGPGHRLQRQRARAAEPLRLDAAGRLRLHPLRAERPDQGRRAAARQGDVRQRLAVRDVRQDDHQRQRRRASTTARRIATRPASTCCARAGSRSSTTTAGATSGAEAVSGTTSQPVCGLDHAAARRSAPLSHPAARSARSSRRAGDRRRPRPPTRAPTRVA